MSLQRFWECTLQPKLDEASAKKPCQVDDTEIVMSIDRRKTGSFRKTFTKLNIDWPRIEKQRREWNKLAKTGKDSNVITISMIFNSTYINISKPVRGSATANQQGNIEARIGDGAVLSRGVCIRKAFTLMRCPGSPCTKGDHCWQYEGEHYPVHPHHINMLADHLQAGKPLNGHDDVPETFRRLVLDDDRDRKKREEKDRDLGQRHKRRRRGSEDLTIIHCNPQQCISNRNLCATEMVFPTSPVIDCFGESSADLVKAYGIWLQADASEEQQGQYEFIQHLTLHNGYDLDCIESNKSRMHRFYMEQGVPEGFAWRYVCCVAWFRKQRPSGV